MVVSVLKSYTLTVYWFTLMTNKKRWGEILTFFLSMCITLPTYIRVLPDTKKINIKYIWLYELFVLSLSKQKRITMRYQIKRECWNEKTFNGYEDNPYWRIEFRGLTFVLLDDGRVWNSKGDVITEFHLSEIKTIIKECKLNIKPLKKL